MGMLMFHSMYVKVKLGRSWTRPSAFGMTCANVQSAREKSNSTTARQPKTVARRRLGRLLSRLIFASPIIISGEQGVRKRQVPTRSNPREGQGLSTIQGRSAALQPGHLVRTCGTRSSLALRLAINWQSSWIAMAIMATQLRSLPERHGVKKLTSNPCILVGVSCQIHRFLALYKHVAASCQAAGVSNL